MRILVVEDEHRIAQTIKKGLEQERYAVDTAYDGINGYDLAAAEDYDVIILDRMLPEMDGMMICKKLREHKNHTPILMLTAKSQTSDKIDGLDAGADDYLTKPFSFEELLARIRALSRRPKQTLNDIYSVGDLTLSTRIFRVSRGSKIIQLSSKEFSILEYLMRNTGKVITKQQIIDHVWDFDADVLPNTVEVTIRNIRKKIERPFKNAKPIIKTVRGFGYTI
ncbi:MAG: Two component transcriptional regulator, winged helix family [Candidatus Roizmanbacteria bacterium GW2011_GWA2_37_7]|uniref:Two component transcriptional regulator, winged helix family n=1 Tax=Candidatus Roizmanbacteria bacterium GW2011_GWA2_37_7 TaxID=1618481 RepID=A0A0G0HGY6_9BACT|nr:MAG: Two component transcriptional regulator, winged helix family [Candidatus Roizmanbacteria bacterium GW2011_GWA2_37_7]